MGGNGHGPPTGTMLRQQGLQQGKAGSIQTIGRLIQQPQPGIGKEQQAAQGYTTFLPQREQADRAVQKMGQRQTLQGSMDGFCPMGHEETEILLDRQGGFQGVSRAKPGNVGPAGHCASSRGTQPCHQPQK